MLKKKYLDYIGPRSTLSFLREDRLAGTVVSFSAMFCCYHRYTLLVSLESQNSTTTTYNSSVSARSGDFIVATDNLTHYHDQVLSVSTVMNNKDAWMGFGLLAEVRPQLRSYTNDVFFHRFSGLGCFYHLSYFGDFSAKKDRHRNCANSLRLQVSRFIVAGVVLGSTVTDSANQVVLQ